MNLKLINDKYNGTTIDINSIPSSKEIFEKEINILLNTIKDKKLLWIKIPIEKSDFIPILTNKGFDFHHCNEKDLMLVKKLIKDPILPTAKNHTLGVGGLVISDEKLLVIKDRFSPGYKLPGGHVDPNESITEALQREVFEETGVKVEFESVVNLGHFTQAQFGESNMYVVCTATASTKNIHIYDDSEILEAKWIDIDEFLKDENTNNYNKAIVQIALANENLKLTYHTLALNIKSPYEIFF